MQSRRSAKVPASPVSLDRPPRPISPVSRPAPRPRCVAPRRRLCWTSSGRRRWRAARRAASRRPSARTRWRCSTRARAARSPSWTRPATRCRRPKTLKPQNPRTPDHPSWTRPATRCRRLKTLNPKTSETLDPLGNTKCRGCWRRAARPPASGLRARACPRLRQGFNRAWTMCFQVEAPAWHRPVSVPAEGRGWSESRPSNRRSRAGDPDEEAAKAGAPRTALAALKPQTAQPAWFLG